MRSRLQEILRATRRRVERQRSETPLLELEARARHAKPPQDLAAALRRLGKGTGEAGPLRVIGELKRRSPSIGSIYETLDPSDTARVLVDAGCSALSVLTEPEYFGGSLETLAQVREAVDVPLLRKDFVLDPYQVVQARAFGADAVLLLAAALDDDTLRHLATVAAGWGLSVLAEAHGEAELERLLDLGIGVIGVNARDLDTFEVDLGRSLAWARRVPLDRILIAESGVRGREDAERVGQAAVDAVLVGEGLMRNGRVAQNYRELFGASS